MYKIVAFYNIAIAISDIFILISIKFSFFSLLKAKLKVTKICPSAITFHERERAIKKRSHEPKLQK